MRVSGAILKRRPARTFEPPHTAMRQPMAKFDVWRKREEGEGGFFDTTPGA